MIYDKVQLKNKCVRFFVNRKSYITMFQTPTQINTETIRNFNRPASAQHKLRVSTAGHVYYIDPTDIIRIESMSNYSKLFLTNGKSLIVSKVLAYFDAILTDFHFVRIHRTHLVNVHYIHQYDHGNSSCIGLNNNEVLPVSRSRKKILRQELQMVSLS